MELLHLRYFVAIANEGSIKLAAETRLHTAQPSPRRKRRSRSDHRLAARDAISAPSIVSRPLAGEQPTIELMLGFHGANKSPILGRLLSRLVALFAQIGATRLPAAGG